MSAGRYSVGIDLGTTHCAVASVEVGGAGPEVPVRPLPIPQLTTPGAVEEKALLPSFLYLPHPEELQTGDLALPWAAAEVQGRSFAVGELARNLGARTPIRLVSSAKSWLCHPAVDRRSPLLPVDSPPEVERVSPLEASARYLAHLRAAWDFRHPEDPLAEQAVTLTVPASFDPAARDLTAEAAAMAGLPHAVLLEEPQAALYSWLATRGEAWRRELKLGDVILVVDVGGGTTDLSLISVSEQDGSLVLRRVAVGDHILLGGDNMDLALAYVLRAKLVSTGVALEPWQIQGITHGCRGAKEKLLAGDEAEVPVVVPSRGSRMIGGTLRTELTREEVASVLLDGFFPSVPADVRPAARERTALTRLGLPYAQEPAVTKHLAAFLARQAGAISDHPAEPGSRLAHPTAVLLNGGVFKAEPLARRLLEVLNAWLAAEGAEPARVLPGADLELSVALGAAYYGFVRAGRGVRIRGGTAASYYVGVETAMPAVPGLEPPLQALCVAPFGIEEGTEAEPPPQEFGLVVGEPVRFRFFRSTVRRDDESGTLLEWWTPEELEEIEPIEANLPAEGRPAGEIVPVRLQAAVTELGTLRLEALPRSGEERWRVEFDVRGEHSDR
ncbi:MAG: Hsp70 family protein [Deltaproteobacteria bacterium]|nr:Hsp70 family protein [Deltaproteobacteria bacterium]